MGKNSSRNSSRKRASFGVLFWIAAILLIAVLLMFNLPTIREVLDNTDFVEVVFEERSADGENDDRNDTTDQDEQPEVTVPETTPGEQGPAEDDGPPDGGGTAAEEPPTRPESAPQPPEDADETDQTDRAEDPTEIVVSPPGDDDETGPTRSMQGTLFFIRVSDNGRILAEPVRRTIRYDSGPLTKTIEALIAGPSADDLNRGLLSLVPQDAELLSARVASGVAFLNFNEAFRFNPMGLEGLLAQLQQVVRTATQFETVDAVQILIEGRTLEYLGGDGVYVGRPLTLQDLQG